MGCSATGIVKPMVQFDVYKNLHAPSAATRPYLLSVQSDLLSDLATRAMVPLALTSKYPDPASRLMPVLKVADQDVVMLTADLASVSKDSLGDKVLSLSDKSETILSAIDFFLRGR